MDLSEEDRLLQEDEEAMEEESTTPPPIPGLTCQPSGTGKNSSSKKRK
jgi:hypothetical protein